MGWPREKLVRHRIPEIIQAKGETCETRIAEPKEMLGLLVTKLLEETAELARAYARNKDDTAHIREELADVTEVVRCLRDLLGPHEVDEVTQERAFDRGKLSYRIVLKLEERGAQPLPASVSVDTGPNWLGED